MSCGRFVDQVLCWTGWYGLAAAKTYTETNPSANVVMLEAAATLGGVWAEHRLYPDIKSNNMLGTYEYSDFPMKEETFGVKPGEHIPGHVMYKYLQSYAETFDIYRRIRFRSKVETVERTDSGEWLVTVTYPASKRDSKTILAKKLILATGMTSEPFVPHLDGAESFGAPIFHLRDFKDHADTIQTAKNVVILGGGKGGWDAAYTYASAGVHVDMVIRPSGHGPVWIVPPYVTPMKKWLEKLLTTRLLTWLSPCIWGAADGFGRVRNILHGTPLGRWIVDTFWKILRNDVVRLIGYDNHPETKKLRPWTDPFWIGCGIGVLNYPTDFFDLVRTGKINIHIAEVSKLSDRTVHLATSDTINADVVLCATGWKHTPSIRFLPDGMDIKLGLPHRSSTPDELAARADAEILARFPRLRNQPQLSVAATLEPLPEEKGGELNAPTEIRPYRLYRFMVPPAFIFDRSIGFVGAVLSLTTSMCAQTQALWMTAYLDGRLPLLVASSKTGEETTATKDDVLWETALHSQFGKWRFPIGYGPVVPEAVSEALPYTDLLLRDLGLQIHRKNGKLAEWFEPYGPEDYRGLVMEWKRKEGLDD